MQGPGDPFHRTGVVVSSPLTFLGFLLIAGLLRYVRGQRDATCRYPLLRKHVQEQKMPPGREVTAFLFLRHREGVEDYKPEYCFAEPGNLPAQGLQSLLSLPAALQSSPVVWDPREVLVRRSKDRVESLRGGDIPVPLQEPFCTPPAPLRTNLSHDTPFRGHARLSGCRVLQALPSQEAGLPL